MEENNKITCLLLHTEDGKEAMVAIDKHINIVDSYNCELTKEITEVVDDNIVEYYTINIKHTNELDIVNDMLEKVALYDIFKDASANHFNIFESDNKIVYSLYDRQHYIESEKQNNTYLIRSEKDLNILKKYIRKD